MMWLSPKSHRPFTVQHEDLSPKMGLSFESIPNGLAALTKVPGDSRMSKGHPKWALGLLVGREIPNILSLSIYIYT